MGFTGRTESLESGCGIGKASASHAATAGCQRLFLSLSYDIALLASVRLCDYQGTEGCSTTT
jgi:hypothetical protein